MVYRVEDLQTWVESGAKASTSTPALPWRDAWRLALRPADLAPRGAQDLMTYPFFSLAKTHRTAPIDFRMNDIAIRVEAVAEHGMATIGDADVLIWAASQIVEACDAGLRTSRLMAARPREILTFTGRGTSARDYHRLKAALDRLQSTTIATSLIGIEALGTAAELRPLKLFDDRLKSLDLAVTMLDDGRHVAQKTVQQDHVGRQIVEISRMPDSTFVRVDDQELSLPGA